MEQIKELNKWEQNYDITTELNKPKIETDIIKRGN